MPQLGLKTDESMSRKRVTIRTVRDGKAITLLDILDVLGRDAVLTRRWQPFDIEAAGTPKLAAELQRLSETHQDISGRRLLEMASGKVQVIDGSLRGSKGADDLLEIRAIDSTHWDVAGNEQELQHLLTTFPDAEFIDE
jgi:hypothetical protein